MATIAVLLIVADVAAGARAATAALSSTPAQTYVTNGSVDALARNGSTLYIGGNFSLIGPRTGPAVSLNPTTGAVNATAAQLGGDAVEVDAVVPDGSHGFYVGGHFAYASATPGAAPSAHAFLVHIKPDGTLDSGFAPTLNNQVRALVLDGSTLFAGGTFTNVDGHSSRFLTAINKTTGGLVGGFSSGADNSVVSLALSPDKSKLYAGGAFSQIGGDPSDSFVAELNPATGAANATFATNATPDAPVLALQATADGAGVYAGGSFTQIGGQSEQGLAELNATDGTSVAAFNPGLSAFGTVQTLMLGGSNLYVGGNFTDGTVSDVAQLNAATGDVRTTNGQPAFAPSVSGTVVALAASQDGSTIYVGGDQPPYLQAVSSTDGSTVTGFDPALNNAVFALADDGTNLYTGGAFTSAGTKQVNDLAALDLTSGNPITAFAPDAAGEVTALKLSPDAQSLYVAGTGSGDLVEALSATDGAAKWVSSTGDSDANALALSPDGSTIYATGNGYVDAVQTGGGTPGSPLAGFTRAALTGTGESLALDSPNHRLYVGGEFSQVNTTNMGALAELNSTTGALVPGFNPNPGAPSGRFGTTGTANVRALALSANGATLYAGGLFSGIGGSTTPQNLASLSTSMGAVQTFAASPSGQVDVLALSPDGSTLYVGGAFGSVNGARPSYVAELDSSGNVNSSFAPTFDDVVLALLPSADSTQLAVGGQFRGTFQTPQEAVAFFGAAPPGPPPCVVACGPPPPPPPPTPVIKFSKSGQARLVRSGEKVQLQTGESATCSAITACTVTITIKGKVASKPKDKGKHKKKRSKTATLLTKTISVPAGKSMLLTLTLNAGQVRKLNAKNTSHVTESLQGKVSGGKTASFSGGVKTKLPPVKKKHKKH